MANQVEGINPLVLRWARERAGLSIEDVAESLRRDGADVSQWEAGGSAPTYVQLEKLAYSVYKRPVAIFFFPAPPDEVEPKKAFRSLPEREIENLDPDTRFHIRQAQALQESLYELNGGRNPNARKIFLDLHPSAKVSVERLAADVRSYLKISLAEQSSWGNLDDALKNWRDSVQDAGVYVFKASLKQRDISGFCLWDEEFPIIYINNSTSPSRQIFSLFHELAHLLLHTGGITKEDDTYIRYLHGEQRQIEVLCNQFASEFLVPDKALAPLLLQANINEQFVSGLATRFKVSREVILRKLLDKRLIPVKTYEEWTSKWNEEFLERRKEANGGNYYATKASYLGNKYLELAFSKFYQGNLSTSQLADYLNVKATSIPGLEALLGR